MFNPMTESEMISLIFSSADVAFQCVGMTFLLVFGFRFMGLLVDSFIQNDSPTTAVYHYDKNGKETVIAEKPSSASDLLWLISGTWPLLVLAMLLFAMSYESISEIAMFVLATLSSLYLIRSAIRTTRYTYMDEQTFIKWLERSNKSAISHYSLLSSYRLWNDAGSQIARIGNALWGSFVCVIVIVSAWMVIQ